MCSPDWVPTVLHRLGKLDSMVGMVGRGFIYEASICAGPPPRTEVVGIPSHLTQIVCGEFVGQSIQSPFPNHLIGKTHQYSSLMWRPRWAGARVSLHVPLRLAQV